MKRTIAAILAADVAGYSRLIAEDEEDTLRRFADHSAIYREEVARAGGRVFNTAGDAILAEFPSAVEGLRAAIAIQERLRLLDAGQPPQRRIRFRMGLTIGDVVETATGDMLGDGVNVAARLEGIAEPGGICVSRSVHEAISARLSVTFRDIGQQKLKNIPRPVQVFRVVLPSDQAEAAAREVRRRGPLRTALAAISVVSILGTIAVWWTIWREPGNEQAAQEASVTQERDDLLSVSVVHPRRVCFRDEVRLSGILDPAREIEIGPDAEGLRIVRVLVAPLDTVTTGQVLAEWARPDRPDTVAGQIRSPVNGTVGRVEAQPGMVTSFGAPPLFRIAVQGELEMVAEVPRGALAALAARQPATVTPLGLDGIEGRVRSVSPMLDPQTQLGRARILLRARGGDLRRGQFARAVVTVGERCGPAVPASALARGAEGTVVYVSNQGRVEGRLVETGLTAGDAVEIRSGLSEADAVVRQAGPFIREGDTVRPIALAGTEP